MDNMSHISLKFGRVKIGSNTALHCFVLQRKLSYSIKYVVYEKKETNIFMYLQAKILKEHWRRITHYHHTGKTIFLPPH